MKKKHSLKLGIMFLLAVLTLAGCGTSPKEEYTSAYKELNEAKTFEATTTISLKVKGEGNHPEFQEVATLLNSLNIGADIVADLEKEQYEIDGKIKGSLNGLDLSYNVPIFADQKAGKSYIPAEKMVEGFNMVGMVSGFPMSFEPPKELEGKYIEIDSGLDPEEEKEAKEVESKLTEKATKFVEGISEESFVKEKDSDVITMKLKGEEVVDFVFETLSEEPLLRGELNAEELEQAKKEFKENAKVGEIKTKSTIVKGNLTKEEITVPIEVTDAGEVVKLTLNVTNKYKSIGEPVEFSIKPSADNILTESEFEEIMYGSMY